MAVLILGKEAYIVLAVAVLTLHVLFILWVIFGALLTRFWPWLRWPHILSLVWGIFIEIMPWSCPLTTIENGLENRAGIQPYQGGFLLHYLDALVYPNIPVWLLTSIAVLVCGVNLAFHAWQLWKEHKSAA